LEFLNCKQFVPVKGANNLKGGRKMKGTRLIQLLCIVLLSGLMGWQIALATETKSTYNDSYSRSIIISAPPEKVWEILGNPVGLADWIPGIKQTVYTSNIKKGVGTVREITLDDGLLIEEHFVAWKEREYVSYIMVRGFPLRGYFATMAMQPLDEAAVLFTWSVYYTTQEMTDTEFKEFSTNLRAFFEGTLKNLKKILEK
jgi:uncharacterized protein YndB with AHSA1/START domain